jgi:alanyl-tRNA synthetase
LYQQNGDTEFLGYEILETDAVILALLDEKGESCRSLEKGQRGWMVVDTTPFYGESGGQEGDRGTVSSEKGNALVNDVRRPVHNLFAHDITVTDGTLTANDNITLRVDGTARAAIMRHHTATHLFHAALHAVVGVHATQAGSSVNPERLRFDFHQHTALTPEQIAQIEQIVNSMIIQDIPVDIIETTIEEARAAGAMMLFDEKYSETVRMVKIGDFSCELCGGTHAPRTGYIGSFQVVDESAVAAGVRRIEAVCGMEAVKETQQQRTLLRDASAVLNVSPAELADRVTKLVQENKSLTKKLKDARSGSAKDLVSQAIAAGKDFEGTTLVVFNAGETEVDALRALSDQLRAQLNSYIIVLGSRNDDKCTFIAQVSDDQVKAGRHAGNLVKEIAKITGGGGGGKPNSAQAGGKQPEKLEDALAAVESILSSQKNN